MIEGLVRHNMLDNLLTTQNLPLQIDGNFGIATAMHEMLLQSHSGVIQLLCLPRSGMDKRKHPWSQSPRQS